MPQELVEDPFQMYGALPEHTTSEPHYDDDTLVQVMRVQQSVSPKDGASRREAVTRHLSMFVHFHLVSNMNDVDMAKITRKTLVLRAMLLILHRAKK
jgi:hypothetical protein